LANDDWLFCGKGSLQSVALEESARVQKAVLQATVVPGPENSLSGEADIAGIDQPKVVFDILFSRSASRPLLLLAR
jgi:hypothetical protein